MPPRRVTWCRRSLLALLLCLLAAPGAFAQTTTGIANLSFGSFLAGSGGTVTVTTAGFRSATGGVIVVGQGLGVSPAQVSLHGTAYGMYSIGLPPDHVATLSDGSHTIALNGFTSNPSGSGVLSPGGTQTINVGATLVVGSSQAAGAYSGTFNITVEYQ